MFKRYNAVFHIASMARSGETVLLRTLAAHPLVRVVHNLTKAETSNSVALFDFMRGFKGRRIERNHALVRSFGLKSGMVLVIKQGVWEHRFPFSGVIMSRNPVSIFASLLNYDTKHESGSCLEDSWRGNRGRLSRWMQDIEPAMVDQLGDMEPIEQFCAFYNRRMGQLLETGCPFVRYEDFVTTPEDVLKKITAEMHIDYDPGMLSSHKDYGEGEQGHGKNDLSRPLSQDSLHRYRSVVTQKEFDTIVSLTLDVHKAYGYDMQWNGIGVKNVG